MNSTTVWSLRSEFNFNVLIHNLSEDVRGKTLEAINSGELRSKLTDFQLRPTIPRVGGMSGKNSPNVRN